MRSDKSDTEGVLVRFFKDADFPIAPVLLVTHFREAIHVEAHLWYAGRRGTDPQKPCNSLTERTCGEAAPRGWFAQAAFLASISNRPSRATDLRAHGGGSLSGRRSAGEREGRGGRHTHGV